MPPRSKCCYTSIGIIIVLFIVGIVLIALSFSGYVWSEKSLTIDGTEFYFPKTLVTGFTMKGGQDLCQAQGMILFEPRDASINHKVWQVMQNEGVYWLNLRREDPTQSFKYATDNASEPSFTNWAPNEPNNWNNDNENCVWANFRHASIFYFMDQWVDVNCNSPAQVVCQERRSKVAKDVEVVHEGKKYIIKLSHSGNFTEAQGICAAEDKGMIIFQPRDNQTTSAILTQAIDLGLSRIWLNIRRKNATSPFKYLTNDDNEELLWNDWAQYEPNNHEDKGEFCVQTHWHGPWQSQWMDSVCSSDGNIVCQEAN